MPDTPDPQPPSVPTPDPLRALVAQWRDVAEGLDESASDECDKAARWYRKRAAELDDAMTAHTDDLARLRAERDLLLQRIHEGIKKAPGEFLNAAGMMEFDRAERAETALAQLQAERDALHAAVEDAESEANDCWSALSFDWATMPEPTKQEAVSVVKAGLYALVTRLRTALKGQALITNDR